MQKRKNFVIGIIIYLFIIYLVFWFEHTQPESNIKSFWDAMWYSIVTLSTVGYGDFYPVTNFGKIVGFAIILGSVGILGFFIGEISYKINQYMEKKKSGYYGTKFEDHYVIIGWNDYGKQVINQIYNADHKVALITNSKEDLNLFNEIYDSKRSFGLFADYDNLSAFEKVNIEASKAVYINFSEDTETLVFIINLKKLYPNLNLVVNCNNPELKETLESVGVNHVVAQQEVASMMVASYLFEPYVAEFATDLMTTSIVDNDQDIQQYKIMPESEYTGRSYMECFVEMKQTINVILIGIVVDGALIKNPQEDITLKAGDYIIIISNGQEKDKLRKIFKTNEGV